MNRVTMLAFSVVATAASTAIAQLHAGDVVLYVSGGSVVTAGSAGGSGFADTRVFTTAFGAQGVPNFATDPGFNTVPNQFPPSQLFGLTVEGSARRWTAETPPGAGHFCQISAETISVYRGSSFVSTLGGPQGPTPAPPLPPAPSLALGQSASGTGFVHTHPTYGLNPAVPGGAIADGVYLVQLRAWVGAPSGAAVGPSAPFYLLLSQNASAAELDAARVWLEGRLSSGASGDAVLCPPTPPVCRADFDNSGTRTIDDIFVFLNAWFANDPRSDIDGQNGRTIDDIFVFLNLWFGGCP